MKLVTQKYLWLFVLVSVGVGMLSACGSEVVVKPVTLALAFKPTEASFTSEAGWEIKLAKATLSFEYIRLYEKKVTVAQTKPMLRTLASCLSPWRSAWAHPGHGELGDVKAEMRYGKTLSLLGDANMSLGSMQGFTGEYEAGEITFRNTDTLLLEGTATKGSTSHNFMIKLSLEAKSVKGIKAQHNVESTTSTVTWQAHVDQWFALVNFDTFQKNNGTTVTPDEASANILHKALYSIAHYSFRF